MSSDVLANSCDNCTYSLEIKGESYFSVLPLTLSLARSRESKG